MSFSEEDRAKIVAAITKRVPKIGVCPICGNPDWQFQDGFIRIVVQKDIRNISLGGQNYPCVVIICKNCGNTHLLNLITLGLGDLIGEKDVEKPNTE